MIKRNDVLIRLQSVSNNLRKLNRNKTHRHNDIDVCKGDIKKATAAVAHEESTLKAMQMKIDAKELDLKGMEEDIAKFRIQLNQIKTNKEYSALQIEIKSKEADMSIIEDETLVMMNVLEEKKGTVQETKDNVKDANDRMVSLAKAVEDDVRTMEKQINEETVKMDELLGALDKDTRYHFERLIKNTNGIAVAEVKNNACQSCYSTVTPQTINLLLSDSEGEMVFCHSCGRILFMNNSDHVFQG